MSRKKKTRGANPRDANLPWYFRSYIDLDDSPNFLSLSPFCLIIGALDNVVRKLVDKVKRRGHQSDSSGGKR